MSSLLISGIALVIAAAAASFVVRNRVIRGRLRFSLIAAGALVVLHVAATRQPPLVAFLGSPHVVEIERLLLALSLINGLITLLFNPWFENRAFDKAPAIVQDVLVVGTFGAAAVFLLPNSTFLAASAIVAAAIGFALQDTLGNAFAGLAIQIEKPFRVGQWIKVGDHEGAVAEVTWRAVKIRTKAGTLVIVPNNKVASETINNYSEPAVPTRISVEVGASYDAIQNQVREAMLAAMRQVPKLLLSPPPDVLLREFSGSSIVYDGRFWIDDFAAAEVIQSDVRQAIYYEFKRRGIEIPYPIQIEYSREEAPQDTPQRRERFLRVVASTPVLSALPADVHQALAEAAAERPYATGEVIVREGDPGQSMFLVCAGRVSITLGADAREVAVTSAGGYFGEMSLLTGDPRTATVRAKEDCTVLEIGADAFASFIRSRPDTVDLLADAAVARRRELDASRERRARRWNRHARPENPPLLRRQRYCQPSEAALIPFNERPAIVRAVELPRAVEPLVATVAAVARLSSCGSLVCRLRPSFSPSS